MKRIILLSSCVIIGAFLQAQVIQGKITYQVLYGQNTTDYRTCFMWFTQKSYLYENKTVNAQDYATFKNKIYKSIEDSLKDRQTIDKFNEVNSKIKQNWYGEIGSNVVVYSSFDNTQKKYCIKDTITFVDWQLLPDTMVVNNMKCQKALGKYKGMDYTAWFAPSIPVSAAPLQFRGLPGLLIKATNNTTQASIEMTELEWPVKNPMAIVPCSDAPYISKREMTDIINKQNARAEALVEELKKQKRPQQE